MGILGWIIGAGAAGYLLKKASSTASKEPEEDFLEQLKRESEERRAEQERRRSIPCEFDNGFTEIDFQRMVTEAAKNIKRLTRVSIKGPVVYGVVQSQSGVSEWGFQIDFNDYGEITGRYWIISDNYDSNIPERLGDLVRSAIHAFSNNEADEEPIENASNNNYFCPWCGRQQTIRNASFCPYCGRQLN